jgi:hypothetical protein
MARTQVVKKIFSKKNILGGYKSVCTIEGRVTNSDAPQCDSATRDLLVQKRPTSAKENY